MSEYNLFLLHKVLIVAVNLLVLVAVTVGMYLASMNPEEFTLVFLKAFGSVALPVLTLGFVGTRLLRRRLSGVYGETA